MPDLGLTNFKFGSMGLGGVYTGLCSPGAVALPDPDELDTLGKASISGSESQHSVM